MLNTAGNCHPLLRAQFYGPVAEVDGKTTFEDEKELIVIGVLVPMKVSGLKYAKAYI